MKTCNWAKLFINLTITERVELLSDILINIFRNNIPNKKAKFKYGEAPWIYKNMKSSLRKRSRLTKRYYVNDQDNSDHSKKMHRTPCSSLLLARACSSTPCYICLNVKELLECSFMN